MVALGSRRASTLAAFLLVFACAGAFAADLPPRIAALEQFLLGCPSLSPPAADVAATNQSDPEVNDSSDRIATNSAASSEVNGSVAGPAADSLGANSSGPASAAELAGNFGNATLGPEAAKQPAELLDPVLGALSCLFAQWYPPADSDDYARTVLLDTDAEGGDLGAAGTYGEVGLAGGVAIVAAIETLAREALGPSDVFFDLGSGLGRLALQVFLSTNVSRAGGVELGAGRHRAAAAAGRAAAGGLGAVVYGVGTTDGGVYAQPLRRMTPPRPTSTGSEWVRAIGGKVEAIAIRGNEIFAVREDKRVYRQTLSTANPDGDDWQLASAPTVETIEIQGDVIYTVGIDRCIWKQALSAMTVNSSWVQVSRGSVVSIAVHSASDMIYGVGVDMAVYKQVLSKMSTGTQWQAASKGSVERIAIYGDTLYGVAYDKRIWKQNVVSMTVHTEWVVASRDSVSDVAFSPYGFHPKSSEEETRGGSASPLDFMNGDVLREIDGLEDVSVLYVSSLFFDAPLLMGLGWAMSATLRPGTMILSQRDFPGCWPGLLPIGNVDVPMPWGASSVRAYIVTPPPLVPQPAWLVSYGPAVDVVLEALGGSWGDGGGGGNGGAPAPVASRRQWADAGRRAWPGSDDAMLWRLAVSAGPALGLAPGVNDTVSLPTLKAIVHERLSGGQGLGRGAVQCAWRALAATGRALNTSSNGSLLRDGPPLSLAGVFSRLKETSLTDAVGQTLVSVIAGSSDEQLALQVLPTLFERKAHLNKPDLAGVRPLGHAARQGHTAVARALLAARATAESAGGAQAEALHLAAAHGRLGVAELLVDRGASLDALDAAGRLPWQVASPAAGNLSRLLSGGGGAAGDPPPRSAAA